MLIIEIEERECSPKKILGDVLAILMCNRLAARLDGKQHYFKITPETELYIAGLVPTKGCRLEKINEVISLRLLEFTAPKDSVSPKNVELLFTENIFSTIEELKGNIKKLFP